MKMPLSRGISMLLKIRYEREADINRAKDLCIMDDLFFALEPVKRTSIFGRKISHL